VSSSPLLFRLMELDQQARWGLFWVGLWGIVFLGMVVNAAVNDYPFGAFFFFGVFFFGVFVFSAWRWYGNLHERIRKREREEALRTSGFDQIDMMPGIQFEQYVAAVLKGLGYHVAFTSTTGDFGVDLIATEGREAHSCSVQTEGWRCGRWSSRSTGSCRGTYAWLHRNDGRYEQSVHPRCSAARRGSQLRIS
jgi:Restriction endonuclease